jgi:hypothetical protein
VSQSTFFILLDLFVSFSFLVNASLLTSDRDTLTHQFFFFFSECTGKCGGVITGTCNLIQQQWISAFVKLEFARDPKCYKFSPPLPNFSSQPDLVPFLLKPTWVIDPLSTLRAHGMVDVQLKCPRCESPIVASNRQCNDADCRYQCTDDGGCASCHWFAGPCSGRFGSCFSWQRAISTSCLRSQLDGIQTG